MTPVSCCIRYAPQTAVWFTYGCTLDSQGNLADIVVSGGRDGDIIVYDKRADVPVLRVEGAHQRRSQRNQRPSEATESPV